MDYILIPLLTALLSCWLMGHVVWNWQREAEARRRVFEHAVEAIARHWVDSLNIDLQSQRQVHAATGVSRLSNRRPDTDIFINKVIALVRAFFFEETAQIFLKAVNAQVSLDKLPNTEAAELRDQAVEAMVAELRKMPLPRLPAFLQRTPHNPVEQS